MSRGVHGNKERTSKQRILGSYYSMLSSGSILMRLQEGDFTWHDGVITIDGIAQSDADHSNLSIRTTDVRVS